MPEVIAEGNQEHRVLDRQQRENLLIAFFRVTIRNSPISSIDSATPIR